MKLTSRILSGTVAAAWVIWLAGCQAPASTAVAPTTAPAAAKPTAAAASAPAAAPSSAPASQPAAAGPLIKVRAGLAGVGTTLNAPEFFAKEKGFFAKHGVEVEITEYNSGGAVQEALASGSADVVDYFPPAVAAAVAKGVKEKIVATDQIRPTGWWLMVGKNSTLQTPADLKGKKIGITSKASTTDYLALWTIDHFGITAETVPIGSPALLPGITSGNVDAAVIASPVSFTGLNSGDARILFDYGKEMPPMLPSVLVASDAIIQSNPAAVSGWLAGEFESISYMKTHPAEAIDFLSKFSKSPRAIAEQDFNTTIMNLNDDGHIEQSWLDFSLSLAKLAGATGLPPIADFYTDKFTPVKFQ